MTTWARNVNNQAVDVVTTNPASLFHLEIAAQFVIVPDGTENGATYAGEEWTNPTPVTPSTPPVVYEQLTPMQFYVSFTPKERILIKLLATTGIPANSALLSPTNTSAIPADPIIAEFWATYEVAQATGSLINPNLVSVQEGVEYLVSPTSPTPAIISSARVLQILAGVAQ